MGGICMPGLVDAAGCLLLCLHLKDKRFQAGGCLQGQYRRFWGIVVLFQVQLDALPVECIGVGLNLDILIQKTIDGFLRFV